MMNIPCPQCIQPMRLVVEDRDYGGVNLARITLHGARVRRCSSCGLAELVIRSVGPLHREIARAILHKRGRLCSKEIVFLRGLLGWTAADLASRIGTEHVSGWESGAVPIPTSADRLLRMLVATCTGAEMPVRLVTGYLGQMTNNAAPCLPIDLELKSNRWRILPSEAMLADRSPTKGST